MFLNTQILVGIQRPWDNLPGEIIAIGLVSPRQNKQDAVENVTVSSSVYLDDEAEGEQLWTGDKNVIETMTEQ